jgi:alpha-amylase
MQYLCFHFQISQPYRLRTYRFFDINSKHDYFDEFQNRYITKRLSERCYLPAHQLLLDCARAYGERFAVSFSVAGSSLMLFEAYEPEVLHSFRELLQTGRVEFTGSTFTHSLASLHGKSAFMEQVRLQEKKLKQLFGVKPVTFCNTECIYSDEIGEWIHEAGYHTVLTEGAKHILGWKSPGYLYCNPYQTDLHILTRNYRLCDDITVRFGDHTWNQSPLTAEKFIHFLDATPEEIPLINIYLDYEILGELYTADTGIFDFFGALWRQLSRSSRYRLITPSEVPALSLPVSTMHVPWAISGSSGEEKDTGEWLGNELQREAFQQLFKLENAYRQSENETAKLDWLLLQAADHFDYMATKWFPKKAVRKNFEVYSSPYQAFINYMNVVNDLELVLQS